MKRSWKTSAGGIATILGGVSAAIVLWTQGNTTEAISTLIAALGTGFGLLFARDNSVTAKDAGAVDSQPEPK